MIVRFVQYPIVYYLLSESLGHYLSNEIDFDSMPRFKLKNCLAMIEIYDCWTQSSVNEICPKMQKWGLFQFLATQSCDAAIFNQTANFASMEVLKKVTQTTIDLLLDVADPKCTTNDTSDRSNMANHVASIPEDKMQEPIGDELEGNKDNQGKLYDYDFWDKKINGTIRGENPYRNIDEIKRLVLCKIKVVICT